jgi:hypothetical protein
MEPPEPAPRRPEQLPLPLPVPPADATARPPQVLAPQHLWASLPPRLRAQCHQTLRQILQEVIDARAEPHQDHAAPP